MVEAAAPRPRDVGDHPIQNLAALFVGIEVLINEVPQKPPALRDPDSIGALNRRNRLRIVLEIREKISHTRQAESHDYWILRGVNEFVDLAGGEAVVEMYEMRIRCELARNVAAEAPFLTTNCLASACRQVADCDCAPPTRSVVNRVALPAIWPQHDVSQRPIIALPRR